MSLNGSRSCTCMCEWIILCGYVNVDVIIFVIVLVIMRFMGLILFIVILCFFVSLILMDS